MSHATVRATILPEIIRLISKNRNVSESEAMDSFTVRRQVQVLPTTIRDCTDNRRCIFTDYLQKNFRTRTDKKE